MTAKTGHWTNNYTDEGLQRARLASRARKRAQQRLVVSHREEFARYLAEERTKLGLT